MFSTRVIAVALPAALAVWFALEAYAAHRREAAKPDTVRRRERIEAERAAFSRLPLRQRLAVKAQHYGWFGPIEPLAWGWAFLYSLCAVALTVVGLNSWLGVALAVPLSTVAVAMVSSSLKAKRQRLFHAQLMAAFDQFAAQLRQGSSAPRAFEDLAPSLPEPLRTEILGVVDQHRNARSLADAMEEVAARYPSNAMRLFIAALRVGEDRGGKLAPAMEHAAVSLRQEFELSAETNAEIQQERLQFIGIVGIVSVIAVSSLTRADETAQAAFTSPVGVVVLSVFIANFVFGVLRVLRIFSKVKGGKA